MEGAKSFNVFSANNARNFSVVLESNVPKAGLEVEVVHFGNDFKPTLIEFGDFKFSECKKKKSAKKSKKSKAKKKVKKSKKTLAVVIEMKAPAVVIEMNATMASAPFSLIF